MSQSIRITCTQMFDFTGAIVGTGEYEGDEMGMYCWRNAIQAAAAASGFHPNVVQNFILEWAGDIESDTE